jgi:hypothetical protein
LHRARKKVKRLLNEIMNIDKEDLYEWWNQKTI